MLKKLIKRVMALTLILSLFQSNLFMAKAYSNYVYSCNQKISPSVSDVINNADIEIDVLIWLNDTNIQSDFSSIVKEVYSKKDITTPEQIENLTAEEKLEIIHSIKKVNADQIKALCKEHIERNKKELENYGKIIETYTHTPCITLSTTANQIKNLSKKTTMLK